MHNYQCSACGHAQHYPSRLPMHTGKCEQCGGKLLHTGELSMPKLAKGGVIPIDKAHPIGGPEPGERVFTIGSIECNAFAQAIRSSIERSEGVAHEVTQDMQSTRMQPIEQGNILRGTPKGKRQAGKSKA